MSQLVPYVVTFVVGLGAGGFLVTWWNAHKAALVAEAVQKAQDLAK